MFLQHNNFWLFYTIIQVSTPDWDSIHISTSDFDTWQQKKPDTPIPTKQTNQNRCLIPILSQPFWLLLFSLYFAHSFGSPKKKLKRDFVAMAASLQSTATFLQSAKIATAPSRGSSHLRSTQAVGKSFGLETSSARLTCSFQSDFKDFTGKCSDAVKIAGFALATSALVVSVTFFNLRLSFKTID